MSDIHLRGSDFLYPVTGLSAQVPSSSTPAYISLKGYAGVLAIVNVKNATTVTGSAITLVQASAVSGTGAKTLAFSRVLANTDTDAAPTLVETAVTSNTFTTDSTNSKNLKYVIDIPVSSMDVAGGFDCVRVGTGNATAATVSVEYVLYGAKYSGRGINPQAN